MLPPTRTKPGYGIDHAYECESCRRSEIIILHDGAPILEVIEGLSHDIGQQQLIADIGILVRLVSGIQADPVQCKGLAVDIPF